jgi:hypothetical protein
MNIAEKKIYDMCVIGSGAAGGFMVKELTAAGADTILIEAGGKGRLEDLHIHDWPYDLPKRGFGLFKQASLYGDDIGKAIEYRGDRIGVDRIRTLGGRTFQMRLLASMIAFYLLMFTANAKAQDAITKSGERGFVALFDGKSLNGWKLVRGHGQGYVVKDGVLVCPADGGGNLFTEKEYSNFVFRFEFKTEPGANNGVGIRAPLEGDAAYQGMEIQILDDGHERYKGKIRSEQHHGSIYDVIPARTGFLKPAGEWNEEEIMAQGSHIRVTLNGVIILDADLNNVSEEATLKKHPGLKNKSGHIGFLGHGSLVEFRNVRVKALPQ